MNVTLLLLAFCVAQEDKKPVDQKAVDAAIERGVKWLKTQQGAYGEELILLTYLHAGLTEKDADVRAMMGRLLAAPLTRTYHVALQAMILQKLDPAKHQSRIGECAQFLVDAMGPDGMWTYGDDLRVGGQRADVPTGPLKKPKKEAPPEVASGAKGGDVKPTGGTTAKEVPKPIEIKKRREGLPGGDHSNTQYAALGLRACHDANIVLPHDVIERAAKQWRESQQRGRGARGWNYTTSPGAAWGSMTAGGVGSLMIYDAILGVDWKKDADVADGLAWLAEHFTVKENPGYKTWHYYFLYGLERAGMLYGTETMGTHEWYREGATYLLREQGANGAWNGKTGVYDTCFAILFLRRATVSLDPKPPPKPNEKPVPQEPARPDVATGGGKK